MTVEKKRRNANDNMIFFGIFGIYLVDQVLGVLHQNFSVMELSLAASQHILMRGQFHHIFCPNWFSSVIKKGENILF